MFRFEIEKREAQLLPSYREALERLQFEIHLASSTSVVSAERAMLSSLGACAVPIDLRPRVASPRSER